MTPAPNPGKGSVCPGPCPVAFEETVPVRPSSEADAEAGGEAGRVWF